MTVIFGRFGTSSIAAGDADEPTSSNDTAGDWSTYPTPPLLTADSGTTPSSGGGWLDSLTSIFKSTSQGVQAVSAGLVNIRGQPVTYTPPPPPAVPIWVYIVVPAAVIGGIVMLKKSRQRSMAGYRRRRSRR